ncbi:hypothetical protein HOH11_00875 [Candidatus Woesearchaeota archaeon]|jgi:hypothetical protein|nr:hypothetical protein [Candidatus Woesearchaeota archaeon]MBT6023143.1 hypothetical protein [Candidatus Woesearchaeota archaeon]
MVISQVKAEKAVLELGLGDDFIKWLNNRLSYRIFMNRITAKRKRGSRTIQRQRANELEEFVISRK